MPNYRVDDGVIVAVIEFDDFWRDLFWFGCFFGLTGGVAANRPLIDPRLDDTLLIAPVLAGGGATGGELALMLFCRGGEHPKYMADPLSMLAKSTRDPWTDDGAEPFHAKCWDSWKLETQKYPQNDDAMWECLPVYVKRPVGRNALIVLALLCNVIADAELFTSNWLKDEVLLFIRRPSRGDGGHDDDWFAEVRERDALDFLRKMPGLISELQSPSNEQYSEKMWANWAWQWSWRMSRDYVQFSKSHLRGMQATCRQ